MRRSSLSILAVLAIASLAALSPRPAGTDALGVPSAATSTVQASLVLCPVGHIPFTVVVRDLASNPVANSTVVVDFCPAPTVDICSTPTCSFSGVTNSTGTAVLNITAGGTTASAVVNVRADGVLLAQRAVASPDQNGDLVVNSADLTAINALLGTTDKRGDLDGDGVVTSADVAILQAHLNHACGGPVHSHDSTWGILKIGYR